MADDKSIFIGASRKPDDSYQKPETLLLAYGNRHGLVTGATGTGKTVSLQVLAEGFSNAGVPVFAADVKGDLSGIAAMGEAKDFLVKRAEQVKLDPYEFQEFPVIFWDLFGEQGHPIRATVSEMGPLLLSRLMDLTEAQEGVMNIAFRIADEEGLLLLDMKDLQSLLANIAERADEIAARYGNVTKPSVGAIQRTLLVLEQQGGSAFLRRTGAQHRRPDAHHPRRAWRGRVLAADRLMMNPRLYATFLLWLMSELFEQLPEVGDPEQAEAGVLLRRGASFVRRCAEGAGRPGRAGGAADPLEGRRRLFRHPEPARRAGDRAGAARQPAAARAARLYAARAEGGADGRRHVPPQSRFRLRGGDHPARHRRGAGLDAGGEGRAVDRPAHADPAAGFAARADHAAERAAVMAQSPVAGQYDTTVDRESAFEMLQKKAADSAAVPEGAEAQRRDTQQADAGGTRWTMPGFGGGGELGRQTVAEAAIDGRSARSAARDRPRAGARQPADDRRGGDQVGGALGRHVGRTGAGARHPGWPEEGF